jgi:peptide/nickel transport system substrate-binding protein
MRKSLYTLLSLLTVVALLAACGPKATEMPATEEPEPAAPTEAPAEPEPAEPEPEEEAFKAGMVTDMGGIDDKSFNATSWQGLELAADELGAEVAYLESAGPTDYGPNIVQLVDQGYDMIVTVGFLLGEDTATHAEQNPDTMFAIVDYAYDPTIPNVLGLTFATDEAAFMAGYLAAGMTKTGKVGTFGGIEIPTVTIFMTGLKAGVDYYNSQHGTNVEVLGMNLFTGNFESTDDGRRFAEDLMAEGADIIMPVAGPVGLGTAAAIQENPGTMLIGVDTDWCISAEEYCDVTLTSVLKNMDVAVRDAVKTGMDGTFEGGIYVGTLRNGGVGIAEPHEIDVPADLLAEVDEVEKGIMAGSVSVTGEAAAPAAEGELLVVSAPCENNKMKQIAALDDMTVQFTMCKPDPAFMAKVAFVPFYIQPREWIEEKAGTTELLEHPVGTGPYYIESWNRGDSIVFKRFDDYWGEPAIAETLVFRWATEGAQRLLELQAGTVDHITNLSPDDYDTVRDDPNLQFLPKPVANIMYLAMTNSLDPFGDEPGGPTIFDDVKVRQAIAMGVDRQRIIDNFYPAGSEVASHFTPCSIPNGCQGEEWYEFDAEAARALLAEAGYPDGFDTAIYYRDVFRVYLPEPGLVAQDIQAQLLENLNINAEVVVMESGEFIDESTNGRLDGLYLLGWGADYLHVTNFTDFHFGRSNPQFGEPYPEIYEPLEEASTIADDNTAAPLYEQANNAIKELVPCVPIAHGSPADAALADVEGAHTAVLGPPRLWKVNPAGRDTLVFLKNAEPISLYCMDETDGESLDGCTMVTEGLYMYDEFGKANPTLATSCEANDDATVFTCYLREGVTFHDGSTLDANDVVRSWDAGMNAASPYHIGNTGAFEYPSYLFDALMNAE